MNYVFDDEDNTPMNDFSIPEYTGFINDVLFRETCVLIVKGGAGYE